MRCQHAGKFPKQATLILARQFVFPDAQHAPALPPQCPRDEPVAGFVGGELAPPEGAVVGRLRSMFRAAVPETAIDKDHEPPLGKNEIRPHAKGRAAFSANLPWAILFRPDGALVWQPFRVRSN